MNKKDNAALLSVIESHQTESRERIRLAWAELRKRPDVRAFLQECAGDPVLGKVAGILLRQFDQETARTQPPSEQTPKVARASCKNSHLERLETAARSAKNLPQLFSLFLSSQKNEERKVIAAKIVQKKGWGAFLIKQLHDAEAKEGAKALLRWVVLIRNSVPEFFVTFWLGDTIDEATERIFDEVLLNEDLLPITEASIGRILQTLLKSGARGSVTTQRPVT